MTDLMQRLRAADPLAGKLPDALAGQPRPPRAGAQVRRRRYVPLLVAGAVAMTTLFALIVGGEGRDGGIAAAAYAAIAPGNDIVHLVTVSSELGAGTPQTRGELWYSALEEHRNEKSR